jgi:hypothetical protein
LVVGALLWAVGCSSASEPSGKAGSKAKPKAPSTETTDEDQGSGSDPGPDGNPVTVDPEVFAHSATTLYRMDPQTREISQIGDFSGCDGQVVDLAVNATGDVYATTFTSLVKVDKKTARCTKIADGSFPNSLAFVPVGTLDAKTELLVGYDEAKYLRIDPKTGSISQIGALNPNRTGKLYVSSGDVVSVSGRTYLTAKEIASEDDLPAPDALDYLLSIDPKTGKVLEVVGSTGQKDLWGVGFWAGTLYAFSNEGHVFAIDPSTAAATPMPTQNTIKGVSFWGAGVTTSAPIVPKGQQ